MPSIHDYDVYIFDCDGVILDSNALKIDAMKQTLCTLSLTECQIKSCIEYFRDNFGKSRFHHVDVFLDRYIHVSQDEALIIKEKILTSFSSHCRELYLQAKITPFFIDFIVSIKGKKFIASGSEQSELRDIFVKRGMSHYFENIYGSPAIKKDIVSKVLASEDHDNAIMFGDALSDLEAARDNKIQFVAYTPYSNVPDKLISEAKKEGFSQLNCWSELL